MVMGQDGKKLSKRHGATSIDEFRKQGYLPEALLNYVALLGASYEEGKELYTLEELAQRFSLDKLNKAPAVFDYKKLEWYNGQYIRMKSDEELAELCLPFAKEAGIFSVKLDSEEDSRGDAETRRRGEELGVAISGQRAESGDPSEEQQAVFIKAMALVKERLVFLSEVPKKIAYLFKEPEVPAAEEFIPKKSDLVQTIGLLKIALDVIQPLAEAQNDEQAETFIKAEAEKRGVKLGDLMMPLRVAVTGSRVSPPLFGSLRILGADCSKARVNRALEKLGG
jgi:glutamyl-tRNA synthetase